MDRILALVELPGDPGDPLLYALGPSFPEEML